MSGTFSSDVPLDDPELDRLGRWPFAERISQMIAGRTESSSLVIGVFGTWGEGKTTVLRFMERALRESEGPECVWFNPWLFGDQERLVIAFFNAIAVALDKSIATTAEKVGDLLRQYGALLAPVSLLLGGLVQFSPGKGVEEAGKALAAVDLNELRKRIETVLDKEGKPIVIIMDDIDRLDRSEIQTVFKLVKLCADFQHITYVLAFDPIRVAGALSEKYGSGSDEAGADFLEKIVQVPLQLPLTPKTALRSLCFDSVNEALNDMKIDLPQDQAQRFARHFVDGLEPRMETPRMAKRFTNALNFALPLLKDEVDVVDLMLVEGIRVFYPRLYTELRRSGHLFLESLTGVTGPQEKQRRTELIDQALDDLSQEHANCARELLRALFPRIGDVEYGPHWDQSWATERRIASREYFQRYFSYAVLEDDVSDQVLSSVLRKLEHETVDDLASQLRTLAGDKRASALITKLRSQSRQLPQESSRALALAIAEIGDILPHPDELFSFLTPFSQAGILVSHLIENLPRGDARFELAKQIVLNAQPLPFASECLRWIRASGDKEDDDLTIPRDKEDELGAILADRIRTWCESGPALHAAFPQHVPWLLFIWMHWRSREETSQYLVALFDADPTTAIDLVMTYVPTAWSGDSGTGRKSDLERRAFDSIAEVVDPQPVYEALCRMSGEQLNPEAYVDDETLDPDHRVMLQFAYMHLNPPDQAPKAGNEQTNEAT